MTKLNDRIDAAFDDYDGPLVMSEEALFWSMLQEDVTPETMADCEYCYEPDYPAGLKERYAAYLKAHGK